MAGVGAGDEVGGVFSDGRLEESAEGADFFGGFVTTHGFESAGDDEGLVGEGVAAGVG